MAVSTAYTKLGYATTAEGSFTYIDITDYPDMGSAPSKIDTTDLSAIKNRTNIFGLQEAPELTFGANYVKATYATLSALAGTKQYFELIFGDEGIDGKLEWEGNLSVFINGAGVDEVRKMTIVCSVEDEIEVS